MQKLAAVVSLVLACVAYVASLSPVQSAPADATFIVNTQSDAVDSLIGDGVCLAANGKCTLRAAIQEANAQFAAHPDTSYTITVPGALTLFSPPLLYALTITGTGEDDAATGDLDIKSNLFIRTNNGQPALVSAAAIGDRVFHVIQSPSRTISVTFANIWMANGSVADRGGGLLVDSAASVTLSSVRVMTNSVTGQLAEGGGIDFRGGGTLTLNSVLVRANRVQGGNNGGTRGGGIAASGQLIVNASTIVSNVVTENTPADIISGYGGGIDVECCPGALVISGSAILSNSISLGSAAQFVVGGGINASGNVTITHSTIGGNALNAAGSSSSVIEGGGLYVNGRLTILTSTLANNSVFASNPSLGMHGGGVVFNFHAQIISSTISSNSVRLGTDPTGYGGGISVGGFYYNADLLLDRSVVESNVANDGGGINTDISTTVAVRNSSVYYNLATNGSGIFNLGVLSLTNSTLYLNAASKSGGGLYNSQTANVDSATFYANVADYDADNSGDGGAIFVANGATQYLRNSLLTGNEDRTVSGPILPDCAGIVISQDYNLIQQTPNPTGCNVIGATAHNKLGNFPNVLDTVLKNNGGATPTLALPPGSAAIDGGDPAGCKDENGNPLTTDQRSFTRPSPLDGPCDIGAFEYQFPTLTSLTPSTSPLLVPSFSLTLTGASFVSGSEVLWNNAPLASTFMSSTRLTAVVPASALTSLGVVTVTVTNPAPDRAVAAPALPFTITKVSQTLSFLPLIQR